ncbi:MAG: C40 family peptidase, partial [Clostridia bacterium]|nr:C40 family peptidase [Clostridia bacterium]
QAEKRQLSENTPKTREFVESREVQKPTEAQTVKAKEQSVIKAKQQAAVKAKADKTEPMRIKTKEEYMKAHSSNNIQPKTIEAVKSKAEAARVQAAKKDLARKTTIDKFKDKRITESKAQETAYSNATKTATEAMPQSKPAIKTKEAYIKSRTSAKQAVSVKNTPYTQKPVNRFKMATQKLTKFRSNEVKSVQAASKQSKNAARHAAKQAAKRAKQAKAAAKATGKAAVQTTKLTAKAAAVVTKAAQALISGIVAAGGAGILVIILIIICIIASIAASPFGIFISSEVSDAGTVPLSQIIAEYNVELTQETEDIETTVAHDDVEVIDNQTNTNLVLAVFAVKTAGTDDNTAEDVVVFDDEKAERLKEYFRAANSVSYEVTETTVSEGETKKKLTITVTGKTKDELITQYALTAKQKEALETLLEHGDVLTGASQSLAITDANVQAIVAGLPNSLPQKRKDVVKNAATLVGKVNYFWGGKSSAIGWDSAWGSMQRVTAAGSPSSGSIRSYGLDCSGYVTWAFNNSGMYVGDGTFGQRDRSVVVSASSVQAGDLCFLPNYSHVGIVVGRDAGGNILVFHCSSSANNVVLSTASSVGFTVFRRPNCY